MNLLLCLLVLGVIVGEKLPLFFGDSISGPAIYQYQQAESFFSAWSANVVGFTLAVEVRETTLASPTYSPPHTLSNIIHRDLTSSKDGSLLMRLLPEEAALQALSLTTTPVILNSIL